MDKCKYLQIINSIFFKNYKIKKNKPNSLVLSIIYSFNLISKENFNIWNICFLILKKNTKDSEVYRKFFYIMTVFYSFFCCYQNNYALPCLLDNKLLNNQMTLHIVFGEHLTQLTNFILISEAINIINNNIGEDKEILELVELCHQEMSLIDTDSQLIINFNDLNKKTIKCEYFKLHFKLFRFAILMTYKILNKDINDELEISIEKLYQISFPSYNKNESTSEI